jgi:hypothetical protein
MDMLMRRPTMAVTSAPTTDMGSVRTFPSGTGVVSGDGGKTFLAADERG